MRSKPSAPPHPVPPADRPNRLLELIRAWMPGDYGSSLPRENRGPGVVIPGDRWRQYREEAAELRHWEPRLVELNRPPAYPLSRESLGAVQKEIEAVRGFSAETSARLGLIRREYEEMKSIIADMLPEYLRHLPFLDVNDEMSYTPLQRAQGMREIEGACLATLKANAAEPTTPPPPHSHQPLFRPNAAADGPGKRWKVRWKGKAVDFADAPLRYRLCVALWDSEGQRPFAERDYQDVLDELYPDDDDKPEDKLKDVVKQVRKAFVRAGISLTIKNPGGKIWLEERPG